MALDCERIVLEATQALGLLGPDGELRPLDSIEVIELVAEIEKRAKLSLPLSVIVPASFKSLAALTSALRTAAGA